MPKDNPVNISVFVSGGGSNLQAVIDAIDDGQIKNARIVLVISSSSDAYALSRAGKSGIKRLVVSSRSIPNEKERDRIIMKALSEVKTNLILLAGYMKILPSELVRYYRGRIINIHPSLIPKHCGKGYYGILVHRSVIESGDTESGATVHFVDEGVDTGEIIIQEKVPVLQEDSPEDLAARVLETEHKIIVKAVNKVLRNI